MKRFLLLTCLSLSMTSFAGGLTQADADEIAEVLREMYIDAFCKKLKEHYMTGISLNKAIKKTKDDRTI